MSPTIDVYVSRRVAALGIPNDDIDVIARRTFDKALADGREPPWKFIGTYQYGPTLLCLAVRHYGERVKISVVLRDDLTPEAQIEVDGIEAERN
jgi:hypothetical protein